MATIGDLQARLDNLRALRAKGVRKVSYQGQSVEYASDQEMAAAIRDLERQIEAANGSSMRQTVGGFRRGL